MAKNALITGAGRGLGRAMALTLGKAGYNVGVHYNSSEDGALSVCREIESYGVKALPIKADLSSIDNLRQVIDTFAAEFGTIDVMINNSGATMYAPLLDLTEENFDKLNNVDWKTAVFGTQFAAKNMIENNVHGCIINLSSVQKDVCQPNASIYASVKTAIYKFTKHAAMELAPYHIRVNSISPGMIKVMDPSVVLPREIEQSNRIPWGRVGMPDEVARLVLFLVDEKSEYITGSDYSIDGGLPLPPLIDNKNFPLPAPLAYNMGK